MLPLSNKFRLEQDKHEHKKQLDYLKAGSEERRKEEMHSEKLMGARHGNAHTQRVNQQKQQQMDEYHQQAKKHKEQKHRMGVAAQADKAAAFPLAGYAKGSINIKPENEGKFTAKANAAGQGVQEYAKKVLAAPEGEYDAATRKQANFAHNAAGWEMGTHSIPPLPSSVYNPGNATGGGQSISTYGRPAVGYEAGGMVSQSNGMNGINTMQGNGRMPSGIYNWGAAQGSFDVPGPDMPERVPMPNGSFNYGGPDTPYDDVHHYALGSHYVGGYAKGRMPRPTNPEAGPSDTVPAMLTPGEAVIPREAAQDPRLKPVVKQLINHGRQVQRMQQGGAVPPIGYSHGTWGVPGYQVGTDGVGSILNNGANASMVDGVASILSNATQPSAADVALEEENRKKLAAQSQPVPQTAAVVVPSAGQQSTSMGVGSIPFAVTPGPVQPAPVAAVAPQPVVLTPQEKFDKGLMSASALSATQANAPKVPVAIAPKPSVAKPAPVNLRAVDNQTLVAAADPAFQAQNAKVVAEVGAQTKAEPIGVELDAAKKRLEDLSNDPRPENKAERDALRVKVGELETKYEQALGPLAKPYIGTPAQSAQMATGSTHSVPAKAPATLPLAAPEPKVAPTNESTSMSPATEPQSQGIDVNAHINSTFKIEGAYSPDDAGKGPTKYGINWEANQKRLEAMGYTRETMKDLTEDDARAIYADTYYKPFEHIKDSAAFRAVTDFGINAGIGTSKKLWEQAGGDLNKFNELRLAYYRNLAAKNPEKFGKYLKGWERRVAETSVALPSHQRTGGPAAPKAKVESGVAVVATGPAGNTIVTENPAEAVGPEGTAPAAPPAVEPVGATSSASVPSQTGPSGVPYSVSSDADVAKTEGYNQAIANASNNVVTPKENTEFGWAGSFQNALKGLAGVFGFNEKDLTKMALVAAASKMMGYSTKASLAYAFKNAEAGAQARNKQEAEVAKELRLERMRIDAEERKDKRQIDRDLTTAGIKASGDAEIKRVETLTKGKDDFIKGHVDKGMSQEEAEALGSKWFNAKNAEHKHQQEVQDVEKAKYAELIKNKVDPVTARREARQAAIAYDEANRGNLPKAPIGASGFVSKGTYVKLPQDVTVKGEGDKVFKIPAGRLQVEENSKGEQFVLINGQRVPLATFNSLAAQSNVTPVMAKPLTQAELYTAEDNLTERLGKVFTEAAAGARDKDGKLPPSLQGFSFTNQGAELMEHYKRLGWDITDPDIVRKIQLLGARAVELTVQDAVATGDRITTIIPQLRKAEFMVEVDAVGKTDAVHFIGSNGKPMTPQRIEATEKKLEEVLKKEHPRLSDPNIPEATRKAELSKLKREEFNKARTNSKDQKAGEKASGLFIYLDNNLDQRLKKK